jgi:hypothetical protein
MSSYSLDAPPLGVAPSDPVGVLARCATLAEVYDSFADVRSILEPVLGPARADGATKPVVRAFARLVTHLHGPSLAAEALAFAAAAAGLMPSARFAELFALVNDGNCSFQPLAPTVRDLVRVELEQLSTPTRRSRAMRNWWTAAHRQRPWCYDRSGVVDGWGLLALAPADRLVAHAMWMTDADQARLVAHPLLFERRDDAHLLAPLIRRHLDAARTNPACTDRVVNWINRAAGHLPAADIAVPATGRYSVPELYDGYIDDISWSLVDVLDDFVVGADHPLAAFPAVRLGWLELPEIVPSVFDNGSVLALVAGVDRPESRLVHGIGTRLPAVVHGGTATRSGAESRRQAAMLAARLDGATFTTDSIWSVQVLKTWREIDANAVDFANCTAQFYGPPDEYGSVLCRLDNGTDVLNAAVHRGPGQTWVVREINTRYNTGIIPDGLEAAFTELVDAATQSPDRPRQPMVCQECGVGRPATGRVCADCRTERWQVQLTRAVTES